MDPAHDRPIPTSIERELEALHEASFAWAMACCDRRREDARDVLQHAYEKILSGQARFEARSSFKTWLFGVIRVTAAEHRRGSIFARIRHAMLGAEPRPESASNAEHAMAQSEMAQALVEALGHLPARQREVLHLVFYEDLSVAEAAEAMGVSVGAARQHYDRGKKSVAERLRAKGVGAP